MSWLGGRRVRSTRRMPRSGARAGRSRRMLRIIPLALCGMSFARQLPTVPRRPDGAEGRRSGIELPSGWVNASSGVRPAPRKARGGRDSPHRGQRERQRFPRGGGRLNWQHVHPHGVQHNHDDAREEADGDERDERAPAADALTSLHHAIRRARACFMAAGDDGPAGPAHCRSSDSRKEPSGA
jgi:hypothetical protein